MLNLILSLLILLTAFPLGYFLAWLCREELVSGRKYFIILVAVSLLASLIIGFLNLSSKLKISIILTLFYIAIVSLISAYLSFKKGFVKN